MDIPGEDYWQDLFERNKIQGWLADSLDCFSIASLVVADRRYRFQMRGVRGDETLLGGLNFHIWAQVDTERGLLIADGAAPFGNQRRIIEFLPKLPAVFQPVYLRGREIDSSFFNNIHGTHYQGSFSNAWREYVEMLEAA